MNEQDKVIKALEARVELLEKNLNLSLQTVQVLATQIKQSAVILEGLSSSQVNQQNQIQEIAHAIDGMAMALGLFQENIPTDDDDTWH